MIYPKSVTVTATKFMREEIPARLFYSTKTQWIKNERKTHKTPDFIIRLRMSRMLIDISVFSKIFDFC